MDYTLDTFLGCDSIEQVEAKYYDSANALHIRDAQAQDPTLIESDILDRILHRFRLLRKNDPDHYMTFLYTSALLESATESLNDAQIRRVASSVRATHVILLRDNEVLQPLLNQFNLETHSMKEIFTSARERILDLLPKMKVFIKSQATESVPEYTQEEWIDGRSVTITKLYQDALNPEIACVILEIKTLVYYRHPEILFYDMNQYLFYPEEE